MGTSTTSADMGLESKCANTEQNVSFENAGHHCPQFAKAKLYSKHLTPSAFHPKDKTLFLAWII